MAAGGEASCKSQPAASLGSGPVCSPCVTSLTSPYPRSGSLGLLPHPLTHPLTPTTPHHPPPHPTPALPTGLVRTAEVTQRRASSFAQGGWFGLFLGSLGLPFGGFPWQGPPSEGEFAAPTLGCLWHPAGRSRDAPQHVQRADWPAPQRISCLAF